ncbi:MAG: hypothetical protein AAF358_08855 [Pseudomonadota bacterium]
MKRILTVTFGVLGMTIFSNPLNAAEKLEGNGIVVSPPKQFPYAYLEEQLLDLNQQLAQLQAIDGTKIGSRLGNYQGSNQRTRNFALNLSPVPLPKIETISEASDGASLSPTKETITQDSLSQTAPALPTATATSLPVSGFGGSAQDLLSEQVNLQYQIGNLRLLLNQSITDRYLEKGGKKGAKKHALLGFRISLNPTSKHEDHAANVTITVKPKHSSDKRPSIVALMPEEKTYNAVALSSKSGSFGAAALTGIFTLGLAGGSSSEVFYVYKDADTVAFQPPIPDGNKVSFGWQFRPVLNQTSVTPGIRYLFVALALDDLDDPDAYELTISTNTYWNRYDIKDRLPRNTIEESEAGPTTDFQVIGSVALQESLAPIVDTATASSLSNEKLLVTVTGSNLFRGSRVYVGSQQITAENGALSHPSDERIEFVVDTKSVLTNEVRITGQKYGFSTVVQHKGAEDLPGFVLSSFRLGGMAKGAFRELTVELQDRCGALNQASLLGRNAFLRIGDHVFEIENARFKADQNSLVAAVEVPQSLLKQDQELEISIPFLGPNFSTTAVFHPPIAVTSVQQLERKGDNVVWGLTGHGFGSANKNDTSPTLRIYAGQYYEHTVQNDNLVTISGKHTELGTQKKVIVFLGGYFEPTILQSPSAPAQTKKPKVSSSATAKKNSAGSVQYQGENLKQITAVRFGTEKLEFTAKTDGLSVFLSRNVTKEVGDVVMLADYGNDSIVELSLSIEQ